MDARFTSSRSFEDSLGLTEKLMLKYYHRYGLVWNREERKHLLETTQHYHIQVADRFAGFFAFNKEADYTYVYDFQIGESYQNRGSTAPCSIMSRRRRCRLDTMN